MKSKSGLLCVAAGVFLSGCTVNAPMQGATSVFELKKSARVPAGVPCDQLKPGVASSVKGCEAYIPVSPDADAKQRILEANAVFTSEIETLVSFDSGDASIRNDQQSRIAAQANWINRHPQYRFAIYGHTDLVGSERYNFELAKRRAASVLNQLLQYGVSRDRVEVLVSYGETRPLVATEESHPTNRRTITAVAAYSDVPLLVTRAEASCSAISSPFLPTYPQCLRVDRSRDVTPLPAPANPKEEPSDLSASNSTGDTTTSASQSVDEEGRTTNEASTETESGSSSASSEERDDGSVGLSASDSRGASVSADYDPSTGSYSNVSFD